MGAPDKLVVRMLTREMHTVIPNAHGNLFEVLKVGADLGIGVGAFRVLVITPISPEETFDWRELFLWDDLPQRC